MKMSQVSINFNTDDDSFTVTVDGTAVDGVRSACIYTYSYSTPSLSIEIEEDMGGLKKRSFLSNGQIDGSEKTKHTGLSKSSLDPRYVSSMQKLINRNKF
jgi:hypothetical protein